MITVCVRTPPGLQDVTLHLPEGAGMEEVAQRMWMPEGARLLGDFTGPVVRLWMTGRMRGGKGGFGSQLRAQGSKMGSRRKKGEKENTGSCRNLDGQRLRVVEEARVVAEYMDTRLQQQRKEAQEKKDKWRSMIQAAERDPEVKFEDHRFLEQHEQLVHAVDQAARRAILSPALPLPLPPRPTTATKAFVGFE